MMPFPVTQPVYGRVPGPNDPIIQNQPEAAKTLLNKIQNVYPMLSQVNPTVANSLLQLDQMRVARGQSPLSNKETIDAAAAAIPTPGEPYGRAVQQEPQRSASPLNIPGNALGDLRDIFTSIPKLPFMLAHEVTRIPQAPQLLSDAVSSGNLQNLQKVPILNLVPGVYTATNILSGHPDEALKHPLFTALDVMPYAKAKVFDAPASMLDESGMLVDNRLRTKMFSPYKETASDIRAKMGVNRSGDAQKVSALDLAKNTPFGRMYDNAVDQAVLKFRGSGIGNKVYSAIGEDLRPVQQTIQQSSHLVGNEWVNADSPFWTDPSAQAVRDTVFEGKVNSQYPWIRELTDFNNKFNDEWAATHGMDPEQFGVRRSELKNVMEGTSRGNVPGEVVEQYADLAPHEKEFYDAAASTIKTLGETNAARSLMDPEMPFMLVDIKTPKGMTTELYPYEQGVQVLKVRQAESVAKEAALLNRVVSDPEFRQTITPDDLLDMSKNSEVLNGPFTKTAKSDMMEHYTHAYLAMGVDARPFLKSIREARWKNGMVGDMVVASEQLEKMLPYAPVLELADIRAAVQPVKEAVGPDGSVVRQYRTAIRNPDLDKLARLIDGKAEIGTIRKEWAKVWKAVNRTGAQNVPDEFMSLNPMQVDESLGVIAEREKFMRRKSNVVKGNRVGEITDTTAERAAKKTAKVEKFAVPARFIPSMEVTLRDRAQQYAREMTAGMNLSDPAAMERAVELIGHGEYTRLDKVMVDELGMSTQDAAVQRAAFLQKQTREIKGTWQDLYDNGFNPQFVPHVAPGMGGKVHFAQITIGGEKPRTWAKRKMDFSPSEGDLSLALNHAGLEHLLKIGSDHLIDTFVYGSPLEGIRPIVKTRAELEVLLEAEIDRRFSRSKQSTTRQTVADELIAKYYSKFDAPAERNFTDMGLYPTGARVRGRTNMGGAQAADAMYLPKNLGKMLEDMRKPMKAYAMWDPVMGVFRTTTLLLSPRWQIYNVLGNALQVTSEAGWGWLKHLPEAWENVKLLRAGEQPTVNLPWNIRSSMGQQRIEQLQYMELSKEGLGSVNNFVKDKAPAVGKAIENWGKPIGGGISKVADLSLRLNAAIDDMTRIAGYMSAMEGATKMLTPEVVQRLSADGLYKTATGAVDTAAMRQQLAEESMRKWSYNWDSMTPWERSVARFVFPFYGFFSHMLRYAYRYAADHPFRVAVTAAFARSELQDWGTALPQRIHNMLLVGKEDEQGNRKGINFAGWNPFADTANLFTPTGWMSQVNPLISTLAEQFGVDPRTGEASLYPTAEFDPKTGRLVLKKRGVAQSLVENIIPQTQAVSALTGRNSDFNELARTNTGAAARLVGSSLGIPTLIRPVNVTQEIAKTELARANASKQALSEAVKTASTGPVSAYPELQRQVDTLLQQRAAKPDEFAQYTPVNAQPSVYDLFSRVVRQWSPN